jgi:hypothetical protein
LSLVAKESHGADVEQGVRGSPGCGSGTSSPAAGDSGACKLRTLQLRRYQSLADGAIDDQAWLAGHE